MKVHCLNGETTIGGTQILLVSDLHGILLDFGYSFALAKQFLDEFLKVRSNLELFDYINLGFLPEPRGILAGLYRPDIINDNVERFQQRFPDANIGQQSLDKALISIITDVVISHAHADHIGMVQFLNPAITLNISEESAWMLEFFEKSYKKGSIFRDILSFDAEGTKEMISRPTRIFRRPNSISGACEWIQLNPSFRVQPWLVDHSLPGANAFLIHDVINNERLVYTGDIRMHGYRRHYVDNFIQAAHDFTPDYLIVEGTQVSPELGGDSVRSEEEVRTTLSDIFQRTPDLNTRAVFFTCARNNLDRIRTFYHLALETGRTLVLASKTFLCLQIFIEHNSDWYRDIDLDRIKVYVPKYSSDSLEAKHLTKAQEWRHILPLPDDQIPDKAKVSEKIDIASPKIVTQTEVGDHPEAYLMYIDFYKITELIDLRPSENSLFIFSESEIDEPESQLKLIKFRNWLRHFQFREENIYRVHCSGHIHPDDLVDMINAINPKFILPVHTEHPELFQQMPLNPSIRIKQMDSL